MNKDKFFQSSAETDIETNREIMICQVVQLRYAYGALWKHVYHLLGMRANHQGGLQREGIVGLES